MPEWERVSLSDDGLMSGSAFTGSSESDSDESDESGDGGVASLGLFVLEVDVEATGSECFLAAGARWAPTAGLVRARAFPFDFAETGSALWRVSA